VSSYGSDRSDGSAEAILLRARATSLCSENLFYWLRAIARLEGIRGCVAATDNCSQRRSCMAGMTQAFKDVLIAEVYIFCAEKTVFISDVRMSQAMRKSSSSVWYNKW
jgi:hypothetical protein